MICITNIERYVDVIESFQFICIFEEWWKVEAFLHILCLKWTRRLPRVRGLWVWRGNVSLFLSLFLLWPQNPVDESEVRGREQFVHVVNGFVLFQPLAGRVESGDRLGSRYGGTLSRGRQQWTHWRGVIHLSDTKERPHCTLQCHDWWQALTNVMCCTTNYLEKYFTQMERRKPAKTRPDANVVWWFFFYFHFPVWTKFVIWSGGCWVREYRN